MSDVAVVKSGQLTVPAGRRVLYWLSRHWLAVFNVVWGIFVILPWIAPVLMSLGITGPAKAIYFGYSFVCHQLPERSYFLLGGQPTYSLPQINTVWPGRDPLTLRQFIGNAQFGYKVAYSDRMVSMYTGMWFGSLGFALVRRRLRPLSFLTYALMALPMAVDGTTHLISDLWGLGNGFRDSNEWLARLTNHALPAWFYAGDALGSFNSWLRLLTGLLFGLGTMMFMMPYLEQTFAAIRESVESRIMNVQREEPQRSA